MTSYDREALNTVGRLPARGRYDHETVHAIFRAAPFVTLGFVDAAGLPQCVPMIGALEELETGEVFVYLHGYGGARFMRLTDEPGTPITVNATLIDGHVLAIAAFSHSTNYRSATIHGVTDPIAPSDLAAKRRAAEIVVNSAVPGRWDNCRQPTDAELQTTGILRVRVESGSAKVRSGTANDSSADTKAHAGAVWTGVVPLRLIATAPLPSPYNAAEDTPAHIEQLVQAQR